MITPQTDEKFLAQALDIASIILKREDLHPYGSHKGRSIPHMIDHYAKAGREYFAISSSGNAALAAAIHIQKKIEQGKKMHLDIIIGQKIPPQKRELLEKHSDGKNIVIHSVARPLQYLHELCTQDDSMQNLRQSIDNTALTGYHSLASELETIPHLSAVFMGTSSGTTLEALSDMFHVNKKMIELHAVQTTSCHPIAGSFDESETSEQSIADAIVDITAHRKVTVGHALKLSLGSGWIVTNSEIQKAQDMLKKYAQIDATPNGALGLAGLIKALASGKRFSGPVVCIICGM
ncbi:MAG TPA: PLP-dependent lyase/thiolase [Candidatus Paceibacterota bacterium]|nr:PLP-dependent lyase/thiolase [Candidatus Paceibacterota bacterium]